MDWLLLERHSEPLRSRLPTSGTPDDASRGYCLGTAQGIIREEALPAAYPPRGSSRGCVWSLGPTGRGALDRRAGLGDISLQEAHGEVSERLMELVSKTSVHASVPGVRIPPSPFLLTGKPQALDVRGLAAFSRFRPLHPARGRGILPRAASASSMASNV